MIELFSADPDIVTPTGLDVDHLGRVFAIESNTHFPPEGYDRHPTDRLLVLRDREVMGVPRSRPCLPTGSSTR
ncbi:MAG: hypothetical protein CM1200mP2_12960 [Planctomycetaceae bacterium]|nr:MAG: hypothetical protein CM1200mP2_12960 [Planctomycetaceae bacterium]